MMTRLQKPYEIRGLHSSENLNFSLTGVTTYKTIEHNNPGNYNPDCKSQFQNVFVPGWPALYCYSCNTVAVRTTAFS
jgi:hypothetical protein